MFNNKNLVFLSFKIIVNSKNNFYSKLGILNSNYNNIANIVKMSTAQVDPVEAASARKALIEKSKKYAAHQAIDENVDTVNIY